jgi:hypothetical protein
LLRVVVEIVLPLLLPTALYLLWVIALRRAQSGAAVRPVRPPWVWLGCAGLMLLALVLVFFAYPGDQRDGVYVAPHLEGGRVVPGHFEKPRP